MTCPRCHSEFDDASGVCPECGVTLVRNVSGVMKTSAVMIAAGDERGFYRSVQDVPEALRKRLLETTSSQNAGTIVIADRAGKERITQVLARREGVRAQAAPETAAEAVAPKAADHRLRWAAWIAVAVTLLLALIFAIVFGLHW